MLLKIVPLKIKSILGSRSIILLGDACDHTINIVKNAIKEYNGRVASKNGLILPVLSL